MVVPNLGYRVGRRSKCRGRVMWRAAVMGVDREERLYESAGRADRFVGRTAIVFDLSATPIAKPVSERFVVRPCTGLGRNHNPQERWFVICPIGLFTECQN